MSEFFHARGGIVQLVRTALVDFRHDLFVHCVDGRLRPPLQKRQRLGAVVGKLLLHDEAGGQIVALIEPVALNKAIHLRAQRDGAHQRGHDGVHQRVPVLRAPRVLLREEGVHRRQINLLGDDGFVVGAMRIEIWNEEMERIVITNHPGVPSISPLPLFICH